MYLASAPPYKLTWRVYSAPVILNSLYVLISRHQISGARAATVDLLPIPPLAIAWAVGWGGGGADP